MATVNEQAYGSKDLWYSIPYGTTQFPSSTTIEERNTLANFTDTIPSLIDWHLQLGRVIYEVEVNSNQTYRDLFYNNVFDRSICFVGQGGKSSYTKIRFFNNQGTASTNPNANELPTQTYDVVNLAFSNGLGAMRDYGNGTRSWEVIGADIDKDPSGNPLKFDAIRWYPLGWPGIRETNDYQTSYDNRRNATTFITNMGVKRNVLVPYVKAGPTDTSDTNAIQTYDLATYLSTYKDSKPYVYSIGFEIAVMYGESIEASSSNQRTIDYSYNLMLMENIGSLNDFYYIGPGSEWQTAHYNNDLFVPQTLKSPHMPIGGYINNGSHNAEAPATLGYNDSNPNSVDVHAVIDCNDIKWDTWINVGNSTAEGTCNKILVADARKYTEDEFREAVRHSLACFGMFFADSVTVAQEGKLDDLNMHLGTIVDGVGYGDYTSGEDNRKQPQWTWDSMSENDYDPKNPPIPPMIDPNLYGVDMTFNAPWVSSPHTLYSFNSVATGLLTIQQLFHKLWENYADKKDEWLQGPDHTIFNWDLDDFNYDQYLAMNPIDCIVSLKLFPYNTAQNPASDYTTIKLGKFNTSIPAKTAYYYKSFDFGSATIFPYFGAQHQQQNGNWMDRLTQYTFYAPFCGTAEIDANKYMGKELHLTYNIDQITGACTATLETTDDRGINVHIVSLTGTCAVDIPITGLDQSTLQAQIFSANQQLKAANTRTLFGLANDVTSMITNPSIPGLIGAAGKFASNDINVESAKYNLHHQQTSPHTINSASPLCGMMMDYIPRIIVSQPVVADNFSEATFRDNKGFACIIPGTIGNHKGYFEINDFKWAGDDTPTDTEIEMIRSLLAGGVYVG